MTTAQHDKLVRILFTNGGLAEALRFQLKPGRSANGTTGDAGRMLNYAVYCLELVMDREALDLLAKSDEWMTAALGRAAAGEVVELEYRNQFELSVCRWLLGPPAPAHDLTRGVGLLHESEEMADANFGGDADLLDNVLAWLVYAERYEECIAKFEREQAKAPGTKKQKIAKVMRDYRAGKIAADEAAFLHEDRIEAPFAYFVARERLKPTLPEADLAKRFEPFLRQRVPNWLKYARRDLFTMWIRIATQAEAGAPARAAIREIADRYA
jgi:hypothetical protein